jgi:hypothetical protein
MGATSRLAFLFSVLISASFVLTGATWGKKGRKWYAGDLHCHSTHSDGDSPVEDVIASAIEVRLDFLALTDHDTSMQGSPSHWYDPAYFSDQIILLYGIEWTSGRGHANIWASQPFDYAAIWAANRSLDPDTAIAEAHDQHALFSINHPAAVFSQFWAYYPVPEGVDTIEVWNNMYRFPDLNRWAGHWFWDGLLGRRRRIPAVGGSDTHHLVEYQSVFFGHGNPTTWVLAHEPTAPSILDGIKSGHVSLSYDRDFGRLDFSADTDEDGDFEAMMGDTIPADGTSVTFRVQLVEDDTAADTKKVSHLELAPRTVKALREGTKRVQVLLRFYESLLEGASDDTGSTYFAGVFKNGELQRIGLLHGDTLSFTFQDVPRAGDFYRVELAGEPVVDRPIRKLLYGNVLAMTNPIYAGDWH